MPTTPVLIKKLNIPKILHCKFSKTIIYLIDSDVDKIHSDFYQKHLFDCEICQDLRLNAMRLQKRRAEFIPNFSCDEEIVNQIISELNLPENFSRVDQNKVNKNKVLNKLKKIFSFWR